MSADLNLPLALVFLLVVALIASGFLAYRGAAWLARRLGYPMFDQPKAHEPEPRRRLPASWPSLAFFILFYSSLLGLLYLWAASNH